MRAAIVVLVLALARIASAAPTAADPLDDAANVIDPGAETQIASDLEQLRNAGVDMAVILVRRTGTAIESYARDAAMQWTRGKPEASGAAVLVIAIDDRKSRIEVNDTLRPKFPDARAQSILDNARGYLRNADYAGAVRAIIGEVMAAALGVAPDMESPHPQSNLPATSNTTTPTSTPSPSYSYDRPSRKQSDWSVYLLIIGAIAIILAIGAGWAAATRKSNFTLSHDGTVNTLQRPFVVDWLWHSMKVVGWLGFVIFIIAAASNNSSSNTSSSWGSSSSGGWSGGSSSGGSSFGGGGSSSSSGGGWSGGGASSSW